MRRTIMTASIALQWSCSPIVGGAGTGDTAMSVGSEGSSTTSGTGDTTPPGTADGGSTSTAGDDTGSGGPNTTGSSTDGPSTGDEGSSSSGDRGCGPVDTDVLYAADGDVVFPMELGDSGLLGIEIAYSPTADGGTLTLEFETTCEGPIYLWGLVWDFEPGSEPSSPDSYYVSVDGGAEIVWEYGCGTVASDAETWSWVEVEASVTGCDQDPLGLDLPVGDHTIVIRNREQGMGLDIAAIAAIVYSHDPATDPSTFIPRP